MNEKDLNQNSLDEIRYILRFCYQCGICTSGCPISKQTDLFKPNRIGRLLSLRLQENVTNDAVWTCLLCHACDELCPQEVHFTDALLKLRNFRVRHDQVPKEVLEGINLLAEEGRKVKITSRTRRIREKMGLRRIENPPITEIRKILETLGFKIERKNKD